jgi:hypothetical protein
MSLRDEIISGMLRSKLNKGMTEIGDEVIDRVTQECAHIARTTYIDCDPEEQEIVDRVQQVIAENIERGLS